VQQSDGIIFVYLLLDNELLLFKQSDSFEFKYSITEDNDIGWPAFGDIDNDGFTDILYVNRTTNTLVAKSFSGAVLPLFPIDAPDQSVFRGTPLLSDINGDGLLNIIIQAESNFSVSLYGYDTQARLMNGFPLLVGGDATEGKDTIHPAIFEKYLLAVSPEKELKLWSFPNNSSTVWPSKYGKGVNNKVSGRIPVSAPVAFQGGLLVQDETYNWPNPAKNYTNIRFLTSNAANVNIDVISTSGKKVFAETAVTNGVVAEEITIDTSTWASGAYFARVTAKGLHQTEQKTIRIAIVK
jgi:hypothetical protein